MDDSDQRMNAKIRNAQKLKIPYMLIVGEQEMGDRTVSLRVRSGERKNGIPIEEFVTMTLDVIKNKKGE